LTDTLFSALRHRASRTSYLLIHIRPAIASYSPPYLGLQERPFSARSHLGPRVTSLHFRPLLDVPKFDASFRFFAPDGGAAPPGLFKPVSYAVFACDLYSLRSPVFLLLVAENVSPSSSPPKRCDFLSRCCSSDDERYSASILSYLVNSADSAPPSKSTCSYSDSQERYFILVNSSFSVPPQSTTPVHSTYMLPTMPGSDL